MFFIYDSRNYNKVIDPYIGANAQTQKILYIILKEFTIFYMIYVFAMLIQGGRGKGHSFGGAEQREKKV